MEVVKSQRSSVYENPYLYNSQRGSKEDPHPRIPIQDLREGPITSRTLTKKHGGTFKHSHNNELLETGTFDDQIFNTSRYGEARIKPAYTMPMNNKTTKNKVPPSQGLYHEFSSQLSKNSLDSPLQNNLVSRKSTASHIMLRNTSKD